MNTLINELTIIIVLYEEKANLVFQCLENIKNFKIYKYILNKKIMD